MSPRKVAEYAPHGKRNVEAKASNGQVQNRQKCLNLERQMMMMIHYNTSELYKGCM